MELVREDRRAMGAAPLAVIADVRALVSGNLEETDPTVPLG